MYVFTFQIDRKGIPLVSQYGGGNPVKCATVTRLFADEGEVVMLAHYGTNLAKFVCNTKNNSKYLFIVERSAYGELTKSDYRAIAAFKRYLFDELPYTTIKTTPNEIELIY